MGVNKRMWCLPMTSSTRYFVEAGRIKPDTRFTAINSNPAAKMPRRGLISAHTCGRFFHAFLVFLSLETARGSFSVGISEGRSEPLVVGCPGMRACYMTHRLLSSGSFFRYCRIAYRAEIDVLRQSAPVPARAAGTAMGLSRFKTVEINSLTEIPRCPHSRRFRLV